MPIARLSTLVAALLLLAACGGDDVEVETMDETAAATAPVPTVAPAAAPAPTNTARLQPMGGGYIMGEATVTDEGGQTQVVVRLTGGDANATHQGHVHEGTCQGLGSVVAPLEPVTLGSSGSGTSTSAVEVPAATLTDGQHIVVFHQAGGDPGPPASCGVIPAQTM